MIKVHIPNLDLAKTSVEYYDSHVRNHELDPNDRTGLPANLSDYYHRCFSEGADVYNS